MGKYLYNGVTLPALPDWDTKKYPYCWITVGASTRSLFVANTKVTASYKSNRNEVTADFNGSYGLYTTTINGTEWTFKQYGSDNDVTDILSVPKPLWTNHDVINTDDGSVWVAASDPVPVSPVKLNPAAMMQGFFVGQAVRRSRK